ncbi:hypothetical protein D3C72_1947420 [compost metagenome]
MQQRGDLGGLLCAQLRRATQQAGFEAHSVFGNALHAEHVQTTVARNIGRLRRPGRDRAQARRNDKGQALVIACIGIAIGQQGRHALRIGTSQGLIGGHQMYKTGSNARYFWMDRRQCGQQLLGAEGAQGVTAG